MMATDRATQRAHLSDSVVFPANRALVLRKSLAELEIVVEMKCVLAHRQLSIANFLHDGENHRARHLKVIDTRRQLRCSF
jgi:hypothetical protein